MRQQVRFGDMHPLPVERRFVSGETHRYLGRQYRLKVAAGERDHVRLDRPWLAVTTSGAASPARVRELLAAWYRHRAGVVLPRRLEAAMRRHPSLAAPDVRMQIRRMHSRWGSCSPTGLISLNPDLVRAPTACIDYVIVHELCHLRVMNHGPEFIRLLTRVCPDWRRTRDRLNHLRL